MEKGKKKKKQLGKTRKTIYVTEKLYNDAKKMDINISEICENAISRAITRELNKDYFNQWNIFAEIWLNFPLGKLRLTKMVVTDPNGKEVEEVVGGNLMFDVTKKMYEEMEQDTKLVEQALLDTLWWGSKIRLDRKEVQFDIKFS